MDERFTKPLFRPGEVRKYLRLGSKAYRWADEGIITLLEPDRDGLTVPYVGLLEAQVVQELRQAGLTLQAIREANLALKNDLGVPNPLIWKNLAHDGRDILRQVDKQWVRSRDRQHGIPEVIDLSLKRVLAWSLEYPSRVQLERYGGLRVISDPEVSGGHPVLLEGGIRVEDVVNLVKAGDGLDVAAEEFGLTRQEVETLVLADFRAA